MVSIEEGLADAEKMEILVITLYILCVFC